MKKRIDKHEINLEKGKSLYFEYYGSKFGMYRDGLGNEYADCNVPQAIENEWKSDILSKLENEIKSAQGDELHVAVSAYMHLLPAEPEWLIQLLQTRAMDTFTAIIFCEQLKNMTRTHPLKKMRVRRFLDKFKTKLLNEPITIHETYKNDDYMQNYDFSDDNIKARISAI